MANAVKNAILKAMIEGAITDLMVKTNAANVYVDDTTTLAAKLSELITSLNGKATKTEMNNAISTAINNLINGAPGTYDTLKEIADYISSHEDVVSTLNTAIGNKADKTTVTALQTTVSAIQTTVNGLGSLAGKSSVSESDLDSTLKGKINSAASGNHSHSNKTVLDGISASNVTSWNGKCKFYAQAVQPTGLTQNDLWVQII